MEVVIVGFDFWTAVWAGMGSAVGALCVMVPIKIVAAVLD